MRRKPELRESFRQRLRSVCGAAAPRDGVTNPANFHVSRPGERSTARPIERRERRRDVTCRARAGASLFGRQAPAPARTQRVSADGPSVLERAASERSGAPNARANGMQRSVCAVSPSTARESARERSSRCPRTDALASSSGRSRTNAAPTAKARQQSPSAVKASRGARWACGCSDHGAACRSTRARPNPP